VALPPKHTLQFTTGHTSFSPFGSRSFLQSPGFRSRWSKSQLQLTPHPTVSSGTSPGNNCLGNRTLQSLSFYLELNIFPSNSSFSNELVQLLLLRQLWMHRENNTCFCSISLLRVTSSYPKQVVSVTADICFN
jgi:hypothetical protein